MADIWLRSSDGSDANAGTQKEAPKATAAAALTAAGVGGRVFASHLHAESSTTSLTLASPGTSASPTLILSVPDWGADTGTTPPTALQDGASVTVTGGSSNQNLTCNGAAVSRGVSYSTINLLKFDGAWDVEAPNITINGSNSSSNISLGTNGSTQQNISRLKIGVLTFNNASQKLNIAGGAVDLEIADFGGTLPTVLLARNSAVGGLSLVHDSDLSDLGSGKTLIDVGAGSVARVVFRRNKLGASVARVTGTFASQTNGIVVFVDDDSADASHQYSAHAPQGTEFAETVIVRTGGAEIGGVPVSRKLVSNATNTIHHPYKTDWIFVPNEAVGSPITLEVEIITDNVTLKNSEIWGEVGYLGTAGFPKGSVATDRVSDPYFGTDADQDASTVAWTTTGLTTPVKQKLSITITPQEVGLLMFRVCFAKVSTTAYYDPKVTVS